MEANWKDGKDPKFPNGESTQDVLVRLNSFMDSLSRIILDVDNLALEMGDFNKDQSNANNYDLSLKEARMEFEKEYLVSQIRRFSGNISKVSEFTGMERTALYRKLKSLNISVK